MALLNTSILKNPMNWLIVLLMLVIAAIAGHLVLNLAGLEPAATE